MKKSTVQITATILLFSGMLPTASIGALAHFAWAGVQLGWDAVARAACWATDRA